MKTILLASLLVLCFTGSALADPPYLVSPGGQYLGNLNANPNDPNSIHNPNGVYGNPNSPYSVNNPNGIYGSPNSPYSATNPNAPGTLTPRVEGGGLGSGPVFGEGPLYGQ